MVRYDQLGIAAKNAGCKVFFDEPLCRHTTFKIGGPAPVYIVADTPEALASLIAQCYQEEIPFFLLGNGSNLLVGDHGMDCAVLRLSEEAIGIRREDDDIICGAGLPPVSYTHLRSLPQRYDCTVLVSSHLLSEIELIADDVGILNHRRLLFEGPLAQLKQFARENGFTMENLEDTFLAMIEEDNLKWGGRK